MNVRSFKMSVSGGMLNVEELKDNVSVLAKFESLTCQK